MNEAGLMDKLLFVLGTFDHEPHIYKPICDLIFLLVKSNQTPRGLSRFVCYMNAHLCIACL